MKRDNPNPKVMLESNSCDIPPDSLPQYIGKQVKIVRMDQIRTLNVSVDVGVDVGDVKVEMAVGQNLWIKF